MELLPDSVVRSRKNNLDRINRIIRIYFACGESLSAEGRIIQAIRVILSN
jgi:hypothetical protein